MAENIETLNINLTEQEIGSMQREKFRKHVKDSVLSAAFEYLKNVKQGHSKMENIKYNKFELSSYMNSPMFNNESRALLLALRTRTVNGIRKDFPGLYPDPLCPLGCGENDTLPNLLTCSVLKSHHATTSLSSSEIRYEDIFSTDIVKQKQVTELYRQLLENRANLLSSQPVASTGPVHCT